MTSRTICFESVGAPQRVDRNAGALFGIQVAKQGEASGHGLVADAITISQIVEAASQLSGGVKSNFGHDGFFASLPSVGFHLGRVRNFREENGVARADLFIGAAAAKSPHGDLRDYVLTRAEEDPDSFGISIVAKITAEDPTDEEEMAADEALPVLPRIRIEEMKRVDVVGDGAMTDAMFSTAAVSDAEADEILDNNPGLVRRWFERHFNKKPNQEKQDMSELKEAQKQVTELSAEVEKGKAKIAEMETAHTTALEESVKTADAAFAQRVKDRLAKFEDAAFVCETIEMSDADASDAFIKKLQAAKKTDPDDGTTSFETDTEETGAPSGGEGAKNFEALVAEKVAGGMKRGDAIKFCAQNHQKEHKAYLERITAERE